MERLYITHYYYPGTDPWKNIMLLPEDEAFLLAGELAAAHPETMSFFRFADFRNYYPARKKWMNICAADSQHWAGNPFWHILIHSP